MQRKIMARRKFFQGVAVTSAGDTAPATDSSAGPAASTSPRHRRKGERFSEYAMTWLYSGFRKGFSKEK
jgi:hypothetical protein